MAFELGAVSREPRAFVVQTFRQETVELWSAGARLPKSTTAPKPANCARHKALSRRQIKLSGPRSPAMSRLCAYQAPGPRAPAAVEPRDISALRRENSATEILQYDPSKND